MTVFILILVVILIIIGYFADKRRDIKEKAANVELNSKELPNLVITPVKENVNIPEIDIKKININPTKVGTIPRNRNKKSVNEKKPGIITEEELSEFEEKSITED